MYVRRVKEFYVWIPMLTRGMGEALITRLILAGMGVSGLAEDTEDDDEADHVFNGLLMALSIKSEHRAAYDLRDEIEEHLKQLKASFHGIIVVLVGSGTTECAWQGGHLQKTPEPRSSYEMLLDDDEDEGGEDGDSDEDIDDEDEDIDDEEDDDDE